MKKFITYFSIVLLTAGFYSCSDEKMDKIDTNPNYPEDVNANVMITGAIVEACADIPTTDLAWYSSIYVEYHTGTFAQMEDLELGVSPNQANLASNSWNALFQNIFDLRLVIRKCSPGNADSIYVITKGIAQVLLAYNLGVATDMWGSVPSSNVANDPITNPYPTFDNQQTIYTEIQKDLDLGIASLNEGINIGDQVGPGARDLMYAGSAASWKKAAYAFKVRFFNHLSKVNAAYQDSALKYIDSTFASNSESLIFSAYENSATGSNLWYQYQYEDRNDFSVSTTILDTMTSIGDPRIPVIFGTNNDGNIVGAPHVDFYEDNDGSSYSRASWLLVNPIAPTPVITFYEIKFIEAECKLNKGDQAGAYAAYIDGINANIESLGMTTDTAYTVPIANYLASLPIEANLKLNDILLQKYIALYNYGAIEAFNDWRRTDFPVTYNPNYQTDKIGRLPYPTEEVASNPNIDKSLTCYDKVWWAQ
jgi:hypothetical protein